jgi:hypothetical protein
MDLVSRWHSRSLQEGSRQASTFAVSLTFIVITSVVMGLRFHVRFRLIQGGLGLDDRKCRPSSVCSMTFPNFGPTSRSNVRWIRIHNRSIGFDHYVWVVWGRNAW